VSLKINIDDPSEENMKAARYANNAYTASSDAVTTTYLAVTTSYTSHTSHNPDTYYASYAASLAAFNKNNKKKIIEYGLELLEEKE